MRATAPIIPCRGDPWNDESRGPHQRLAALTLRVSRCLRLERGDGRDDVGQLVVRHRREQRQRADLLGEPLGDRQGARAVPEVGVRPGPVDREGVVHGGRDVELAEVRTERLAVGPSARRTGGRRGRRPRRRARAAPRRCRRGPRAAAAPRRRRSSFQPSSRRSFTRRIAAWSASRRAVVPTT